MSLFSWLFPASRSTPSTPPARPQATAPAGPAPGEAGRRKNERMVRRELLYTVVRESMVRAGVLSSSYKFKVLSLDQRGSQFLVMVDLATEYDASVTRLNEIEAMVVQAAKDRFDIWVTAVYWRVTSSNALGARPTAPATASAAPQPSTAAAPAAAPLIPPRLPATPPTPPMAPPAAQRYEPIEADEVAAFKQALQQAAETRTPDGEKGNPQEPRRSGPLLPPSAPTGFEDTVLHETPELAPTQYGTLR